MIKSRMVQKGVLFGLMYIVICCGTIIKGDGDDYGRRISVVADADGEHLVTHYEYNNQGEIVCILKPDQRYQRTIRDGRGMVSMEITGIKIGDNYQDKAVTRFFYDLNGNLIKKVDPEGVTEVSV